MLSGPPFSPRPETIRDKVLKVLEEKDYKELIVEIEKTLMPKYLFRFLKEMTLGTSCEQMQGQYTALYGEGVTLKKGYAAVFFFLFGKEEPNYANLERLRDIVLRFPKDQGLLSEFEKNLHSPLVKNLLLEIAVIEFKYDEQARLNPDVKLESKEALLEQCQLTLNNEVKITPDLQHRFEFLIAKIKKLENNYTRNQLKFDEFWNKCALIESAQENQNEDIKALREKIAAHPNKNNFLDKINEIITIHSQIKADLQKIKVWVKEGQALFGDLKDVSLSQLSHLKVDLKAIDLAKSNQMMRAFIQQNYPNIKLIKDTYFEKLKELEQEKQKLTHLQLVNANLLKAESIDDFIQNFAKQFDKLMHNLHRLSAKQEELETAICQLDDALFIPAPKKLNVKIESIKIEEVPETKVAKEKDAPLSSAKPKKSIGDFLAQELQEDKKPNAAWVATTPLAARRLPRIRTFLPLAFEKEVIIDKSLDSKTPANVNEFDIVKLKQDIADLEYQLTAKREVFFAYLDNLNSLPKESKIITSTIFPDHESKSVRIELKKIINFIDNLDKFKRSEIGKLIGVINAFVNEFNLKAKLSGNVFPLQLTVNHKLHRSAHLIVDDAMLFAASLTSNQDIVDQVLRKVVQRICGLISINPNRDQDKNLLLAYYSFLIEGAKRFSKIIECFVKFAESNRIAPKILGLQTSLNKIQGEPHEKRLVRNAIALFEDFRLLFSYAGRPMEVPELDTIRQPNVNVVKLLKDFVCRCNKANIGVKFVIEQDGSITVKYKNDGEMQRLMAFSDAMSMIDSSANDQGKARKFMQDALELNFENADDLQKFYSLRDEFYYEPSKFLKAAGKLTLFGKHFDEELPRSLSVSSSP